MEIYDNFVFYGSFRNTIDKLPEDLRGKFALAIINYGTAGEIDDSDDYISAIMPLVIPNINASQERQVKNTIKGKEGGRPVEVNRETVIQLKKQGLTQMSIAVEMKCDVSTVKRILRESDIPDGIGAKGVITSHNQEEDKDKEEDKIA